jgi:hypothetical protein
MIAEEAAPRRLINDQRLIEYLTVIALLEPARPLPCAASNPEAHAHAAWAFAVSEFEEWL